jgi:hypothetical protein
LAPTDVLAIACIFIGYLVLFDLGSEQATNFLAARLCYVRHQPSALDGAFLVIWIRSNIHRDPFRGGTFSRHACELPPASAVRRAGYSVVHSRDAVERARYFFVNRASIALAAAAALGFSRLPEDLKLRVLVSCVQGRFHEWILRDRS